MVFLGIFGKKRLYVEAFFAILARSILGHFWLILGQIWVGTDLVQNDQIWSFLGTGRMRPVHEIRSFLARNGLFHARVACDPCLKGHFWVKMGLFHARVVCDPCMNSVISG